MIHGTITHNSITFDIDTITRGLLGCHPDCTCPSEDHAIVVGTSFQDMMVLVAMTADGVVQPGAKMLPWSSLSAARVWAVQGTGHAYVESLPQAIMLGVQLEL
jgi:hypothetical protein